MKHTDYISLVEQKAFLIKKENMLFWDLWCLNYVFERIEISYIHYDNMQQCYDLLWQINDTKNMSIALNSTFDKLLELDNDEFEELDLFDVPERSVREIIIGIESIVSNLRENNYVIYNAYENPIHVIDVEIDGISISKENNNNIYINEVNAQLKPQDLSTLPKTIQYVNPLCTSVFFGAPLSHFCCSLYTSY